MELECLSLSPVLGGEGGGEGLCYFKSEISMSDFKTPLTLTLSPLYRGEGIRD